MTLSRSPASRLWAASSPSVRAALVVHALLETGSLAQSFFYDIVGGSAVVVALIGIWRNRPDRRLPLAADGAGPGHCSWPATSCGTGTRSIGEDPFPSMADALYLAGYPFIAARPAPADPAPRSATATAAACSMRRS